MYYYIFYIYHIYTIKASHSLYDVKEYILLGSLFRNETKCKGLKEFFPRQIS